LSAWHREAPRPLKFPRLTVGLRPAIFAAAFALTTALSNPLGASAETTIEIAPMSQQNGAWAGARLGTSPTETIGSAGCAITAVTMMLRYYDINTDPGAFNAWLTASGGYAFDDMLIWDAVTRYSGGRVAFSGWLGPDLNVISLELDAARPVVAEVQLGGNQHFVLLTGYTLSGGLVINDPWFGDVISFNARYGDPATGILSIRTFMVPDPVGLRVDGRVNWVANAISAAQLAR
jgi:peptidase C39-like protein